LGRGELSETAVLLDTCAALWLTRETPLSEIAEAALAKASSDGAIYVSPITAWEVGLLASRGRLALSRPPLEWFEVLIDSGAILAPMSPAVLVASSNLPAQPPRDPADRIIAATARAFGYRLITRDRELLQYGAAGHLDVIAC
jgi:PIN domain nuclease of toxin-antitoxin system